MTTAATFDDAYTWVSRAVTERLVTVSMLRAALADRTRMRWRTWLTDALADAEDGVQFPLERRYARDVERAHGLPKAQRQVRSTIGGRTHYKDNLYENTASALRSTGLPTIGPNGYRRTKTGTTATWPQPTFRPTGSAPST